LGSHDRRFRVGSCSMPCTLAGSCARTRPMAATCRRSLPPGTTPPLSAWTRRPSAVDGSSPTWSHDYSNARRFSVALWWIFAVLVVCAGAARAQSTVRESAPGRLRSCIYKQGQSHRGGTLYHGGQTFTNTCAPGWKPSLAPSLRTRNGPAGRVARRHPPRLAQQPVSRIPHCNAARRRPRRCPVPAASTSTAAPVSLNIAVQGSHGCDGCSSFLILR